MAIELGRHRYIFLDALRGIAAILVVQRHTSEIFGGKPFQSSYLAVDFFFVLSGFVIAHAYDEKLANGMPGRSFLWRRFVRLYPMFIVGLIAMTGFDLATLEHLENHTLVAWGITFLFNALFLPISLLAQPFILGPAWSLFCEIFANVFYACIAATGMNWKKAFAPVFVGAIFTLVFLSKFGNLDIGWFFSSIEGGLARVLFSFFAGVFIYNKKEKLPSFGLLAGMLCIGGLVLVLCLSISAELRMYYDAFVVLIFLPFIVAAGACVKLPQLALPICQFLGAASYPIYVLHLPLAAISFWLAVAACGQLSESEVSLAVWIFIVAVVVLSWALDVYVDEPLRRRILRKSNRRRLEQLGN